MLPCLLCTARHTALDDCCAGSLCGPRIPIKEVAAIIVDNRNVAVTEVDHAGSIEGSRAWGGGPASMSGRLLLVIHLLIVKVL